MPAPSGMTVASLNRFAQVFRTAQIVQRIPKRGG